MIPDLQKISKIRLSVSKRSNGSDHKVELVLKLLRLGHQVLMWLAGSALLVSLVSITLLIVYAVVKMCWKAKTLIDGWLTG